jgi:hypothetical protein
MPNRWDMPPMYIQSGDPETENIVGADPYPGLLGARVTVVQPTRTPPGAEDGRSKTYQRIKTDSTMTVAPFRGAVAWWSDKTQYLVTTTVTTLGRGRIAGVFQNAITPGAIGFVQTGGPATVKYTDTTTAVPDGTGQFVIPSATNAKADCLAAGSAATYPPLGVTAGSFNAAAREGIVDLDVPQTT